MGQGFAGFAVSIVNCLYIVPLLKPFTVAAFMRIRLKYRRGKPFVEYKIVI
jgi:hypothetical protein